jgi:hypothetical protein
LRRIERTHARMDIKKEHFDEYVRLFLQAAIEVGESQEDVNFYARSLDELQVQFIFDGDSKRVEVMKRIKSIQAAISDLDDLAWVSTDLDRIERDLMRGKARPRARSSAEFLVARMAPQ